MTTHSREERAFSVGGEEQVKRRDVSGSRSLGTTSTIQRCGFAMLCRKCVSVTVPMTLRAKTYSWLIWHIIAE